jgi:hypothetical protein
MTATAIERNTIPRPLRADREAIEVAALPVTRRASLPDGLAELADGCRTETRTGRRPHPVFHWG